MGGANSGHRCRIGAKSTTDDYIVLDVRHLNRQGALNPGAWGEWQWSRNGRVLATIQVWADQDEITLTYWRLSLGADGENEEQPVRIERTKCNLGGSRSWFICPTADCGRRVAVLYAGENFACRHCYKLVYPSSREDEGERAARRANRIQMRLGWDYATWGSYGYKPKWMRWLMYLRLAEKHNELMEQSMNIFAKKYAPEGSNAALRNTSA